jgi:hypothetical protein
LLLEERAMFLRAEIELEEPVAALSQELHTTQAHS